MNYKHLLLFLNIETKSFFRNQRLKQIQGSVTIAFLCNVVYVLFKCFLIPSYSFLFIYTISVIAILIFSISYLPLLFSWQSQYMYKLVAIQSDFRSYIHAKWVFVNIPPLLMAVVLTPFYLYFYPSFVPVIWQVFLFNFGVLVPFMFWFSFQNRERIRVNAQRGINNFEGVSVQMFVMNISAVLIFLALGTLSWWYFDAFFLFLGIAGILGGLSMPWILLQFVRKFGANKYEFLKHFSK